MGKSLVTTFLSEPQLVSLSTIVIHSTSSALCDAGCSMLDLLLQPRDPSLDFLGFTFVGWADTKLWQYCDAVLSGSVVVPATALIRRLTRLTVEFAHTGSVPALQYCSLLARLMCLLGPSLCHWFCTPRSTWIAASRSAERRPRC